MTSLIDATAQTATVAQASMTTQQPTPAMSDHPEPSGLLGPGSVSAASMLSPRETQKLFAGTNTVQKPTANASSQHWQAQSVPAARPGVPSGASTNPPPQVIVRSMFRPWNSFLAKKAAAEAAAVAAVHAAERAAGRVPEPAVNLLTAGLIETYEAINTAYYHSRRATGEPVVPSATTLNASTGSGGRDGGAATDRQPSIASSASPVASVDSDFNLKDPTRTDPAEPTRVSTYNKHMRRGTAVQVNDGSQPWMPEDAMSPESEDGDAQRNARHVKRGSAAGSSALNVPSLVTAAKDRSRLATAAGVTLRSATGSIARTVSNASGNLPFTSVAKKRNPSNASATSSNPSAGNQSTEHAPASSHHGHHGHASIPHGSSHSHVRMGDASDRGVVEEVVVEHTGTVDSGGHGHNSHHNAALASVQNQQHTQQQPQPQQQRQALDDEDVPQGMQYCDSKFDYIVRPGEMFHNRYMLEKVIGRGSFGQVVRAYDTRTKAHVAIKIIKNNKLYVEQALSEVRMTSYLNRIDPDDKHSIMRIFDKFIFRGHQCLVLELLSFSLYDLLRSTEFYGVSLNLVRKFSRQILSCLAFLARDDIRIVHCDLKPENVLLRHPQRSAIKVVDFGASCRVSENMFTYVQSRFYRAPEVILGLPYDTQVDVWSLGCMLVELHTGYPLFAGQDEGDQMAAIVQRLGMPPQHMLDGGKKTHLFFDRMERTHAIDLELTPSMYVSAAFGDRSLKESQYVWVLKPDLGKRDGFVDPGSISVQKFVDDFTSASGGRRKRVSGGHSEHDYSVFLDLARDMLLFDPSERLTATDALRNAFVMGTSLAGPSGATASPSGRDSPPPPVPVVAPGGVDQTIEPGRAAPVYPSSRSLKNASGIGTAVGSDLLASEVVSGDKTPTSTGPGPSLSTSGSGSRDVGGSLRLSKSESAIAPIAAPMHILHSSEWAEEVGIEPPLWRSLELTTTSGRGAAAATAAAHLQHRIHHALDDDEFFARASKTETMPCAGSGAPLRLTGIGAKPPRMVKACVRGTNGLEKPCVPAEPRVVPRYTMRRHRIEVARQAAVAAAAAAAAAAARTAKAGGRP